MFFLLSFYEEQCVNWSTPTGLSLRRINIAIKGNFDFTINCASLQLLQCLLGFPLRLGEPPPHAEAE